LVSLLATFVHFYATENLAHNIVMVSFAEEESKKKMVLNSVLKATRARVRCHWRTYFDAINSRKGLLVLDVKSKEHLVMPRIKIMIMRFTKRFL
jgi:acetylornithine deacetylase